MDIVAGAWVPCLVRPLDAHFGPARWVPTPISRSISGAGPKVLPSGRHELSITTARSKCAER